MGEKWDIYDKNKKKTGRLAERNVDQLKEGEYHIVVTGIIMNSDNKILISKRAAHKKFGLMWECNGGSILAGETSLEGVLREIKEEPIEQIEGKCIAVIHRINDNDDKLIIVPNGREYTDEQIRKLTNFQEQYFESEIIR